MSDTIQVVITAEQRVKLSKVVEMKREDFAAYEEAIEEIQDGRELEEFIASLANRYGFYGDGHDIADSDDPEEITFEVLSSPKEQSNG